MNTFDLTLDLSKQVSMEPLRLRQGDKSGTTVRATVYDHGELVSGSYTARIAMRHPGTGATYYRETGTFSNGVATFTIDEQYAATVTGRTTGYVQLLQGSTVIASTADFPVVILRDATEGAVPGEVYDSAIEDALAELDEATGRISVMVQEQVAEELAAHPEWTTTVQDNSVTDAKLVQTGGILSRVDRLMYRLDNLLTGDTGEQEVAVVADAAATPVAGLSVYGRSVQDGTPTPDAPVAIQSVEGNLAQPTVADGYTLTNRGVTWTVADGVLTASGTASGGNAYAFDTGSAVNNFDCGTLPAGTYTAVTDGPHMGIRVGAGSSLTNIGIAMGRVTFTLAEATHIYVTPYVQSGDTVDGASGMVAVYGKSVPVPYVPYGHAGLWARGRNLLDPASWYMQMQNGPTPTVADDGRITIDGTVTGAYQFVLHRGPLAPVTHVMSYTGTMENLRLRVYDVTDSNDLYRTDAGESLRRPFVPTEGHDIMVYLQQLLVDNVHTSYDGYVQMEIGSVAHAYQPYISTVTPVPLGGHVLRSLPDGTRDEVTVDERGHAVLVQRVGEVTLDGSSDEVWVSMTTLTSGKSRYRVKTPGAAKGTGSVNGMVRSTRFVEVSDSAGTYACVTGVNLQVLAGAEEAIFYHEGESLSDWTAWLAENPVTLQYLLATPVTHDLGYVDPVALTSPDATLQAATGIATTFRADYERDLNTTLARLEAAIAALA